VLTFRGWTDFFPRVKKLAQIRIIMIIIIISQFLKLFSHKNVRYDENDFFATFHLMLKSISLTLI
jgi:hypothetical protein